MVLICLFWHNNFDGISDYFDSNSIELLEFINILEKELNIKAKKELKEMQLGDSLSTYADCNKLENFIKFKPKTNLNEGIRSFIDWYKAYYFNWYLTINIIWII